MVNFDAANAHFDYPDVTRHWSPHSGQLGGGDVLVTLFAQGWQLSNEVFHEEHWLSGSRPVTIYHVTLMRAAETLRVPVFANPFVRSLMRRGEIGSRPLAKLVEA